MHVMGSEPNFLFGKIGGGLWDHLAVSVSMFPHLISRQQAVRVSLKFFVFYTVLVVSKEIKLSVLPSTSRY